MPANGSAFSGVRRPGTAAPNTWFCAILPRPISAQHEHVRCNALLYGVIGLGRLTSGSSVLGGLSGIQPGARRPHFAGTGIPCLMRFHLRLTHTLAEFIEP